MNQNAARAFGNVKLTLKPEVRPRTTMSYSDSLYVSGVGASVPVPVDQPNELAVPSWDNIRGVEYPGVVKGFPEPRPLPAEAQAEFDAWVAETTRTRIGGPLEDYELSAKREEIGEKYGYRRWMWGDFFEAQIHGGVRWEDVERVDFEEPPELEIIERLDALGIPWTTGGPTVRTEGVGPEREALDSLASTPDLEELRGALHSWAGYPSDMRIHMHAAMEGEPWPDNESGASYRRRAEALLAAVRAGDLNDVRLYRGGGGNPAFPASYSEKREVASRYGEVEAFPPGTLRGIRMRDYIASGQDVNDERQWVAMSATGVRTEGIEDYMGGHVAPEGEPGASMDNLEGIFPPDIYSADGARLYGAGGDAEGWAMDRETVGIIQDARGKPNKKIRVYRAIPDDIGRDAQLARYQKERAYKLKHGRYPPGTDTKGMTDDEYHGWLIGDPMDEYRPEGAPPTGEIARLEALPPEPPPTINPGDWVTPNRAYARMHGESNLGFWDRGGDDYHPRYKIISRLVRAGDLYTDGDVHEWGWVPAARTEGVGGTLHDAFHDVVGQRVYQDKEGNYRYRKGNKPGGPIAPWSDEASRPVPRPPRPVPGRERVHPADHTAGATHRGRQTAGREVPGVHQEPRPAGRVQRLRHAGRRGLLRQPLRAQLRRGRGRAALDGGRPGGGAGHTAGADRLAWARTEGDRRCSRRPAVLRPAGLRRQRARSVGQGARWADDPGHPDPARPTR